MFRVGIIGMGMMGWFHARRYLQMPDVRLVAIADITPARLEATEAVTGNMADAGPAVDLSNLARYGDGTELIAAGGVDMIDICLPSYLHARYAIAALQAGHNVLCEKPMALSVSEADQMIQAAERAGRQLMVAQCIRFWPEYLYLKQRVDDGSLGRLLSLNMYRIGGRPIWSWENWFTDPARSGGPPLDLHIHDVDYVQYLLGKPEQIQATARRSAATGSYDVIHALFGYADGPQVHIHAGWSKPQIPFQAGFDAWFEEGFLRFDGRTKPALQLFDDLQSVQGRPVELEARDAYYDEIAYFIHCVQTGQPPLECMPQSARDSLWVIEREIEAFERGTTGGGQS